MKQEPRKITDVRMHPRPHLDELLALYILRKYGQTLFPGITKAKIHLVRAEGDATGEADDHEGNLALGVLALGTGKGPFDEHTLEGVSQNECCATLVAKYLGVQGNPELRQLLNYTLNNDRKGTSTQFDLAQIIQALYFLHGKDKNGELAVVTEALGLITALWERQRDFHVNAAQAFAEADRLTFMRGHRKIRVAMMKTNNLQAAKYAHYKRADIAVIRNSRGHTQVLVNHKTLAGVSLVHVVRLLRIEEQRAINANQLTADWEAYGQEGMLLNWYFHREGTSQSLLNGSATAPGVTPSKLNSDQIFDAISAGLTEGWRECMDQLQKSQTAVAG